MRVNVNGSRSIYATTPFADSIANQRCSRRHQARLMHSSGTTAESA
ncbi:MAG: hypothetical protein VB140_10355 [Burkholderia sp.]